MSRSLRQRKSRPSYASLGENGTEDDLSKPSSSSIRVDDGGASESDFVPEKDKKEEETRKDEGGS